jgi:kynurenine formamidase
VTVDKVGGTVTVLAVGVDPAALGPPDGALSVRSVEDLAAAREWTGPDVDAAVAAQRLPDGTGMDALAAVREGAPAAACFLLVEDVDAVETGPAAPVVECVLGDAGEALTDRLRTATAAGDHAPFPVREDEGRRVAAARSLLAGFRPADLEALSTRAARAFDVPLATINLLDRSHVHVVGCHGADVERLDRRALPCSYTVLDEGVTVIEGLAGDPRFADSSAVERYGLSWYAGAPVTVDGHRVGTLCVYDTELRGFDGGDRRRLLELAAEAGRRLAPDGAGAPAD